MHTTQKFIYSVLIALLFISCYHQKEIRNIKVVAHRGGMTDKPENTMAAYKTAHALGVDIIEIDVRINKDKELFILHDYKLDRTTDTVGFASNFSLKELKEFDAGSWFHSDYTGLEIPSLSEVLIWAKQNKVELLLDLKGEGLVYAELVAEAIREHKCEKQIILGVRTPVQSQIFSNVLYQTKQLAFIKTPEQMHDYTSENVEIIRLWAKWLKEKPELSTEVKDLNKKLMVNGTSGSIEETNKLLRYSPDWILSDNPKNLIQSLNTAD